MVFVYTWWTLNVNKLVGFAMGNTHWRKSPTTQWRKKCNTYNVIALAVVVVDSRMSILGLLEEGFHRQRFSVVTGCSLGFLWVEGCHCCSAVRGRDGKRNREFGESSNLPSLLCPVNSSLDQLTGSLFGLALFTFRVKSGTEYGLVWYIWAVWYCTQ